MRANTVKAMMKAGRPAVSAWLTMNSAFGAEIVAHCGFDCVTVDMQHGMLDFAEAIAILQAISTSQAMPFARPSGSDAVEIMRLLDAGAWGVIAPQVDTPDIARRVVAACRYPPLGKRSFGPRRGVTYGGADYHLHANDEIFVFVMIESKEAVENLDAILAVEGIDGTFIGPNDLSLSYGGGTGCEPKGELAEIIEQVRAKTAARGLVPGIFCSDGDMGMRRIQQGFMFVSTSSDTAALKSGMESQLAKIRGSVAKVAETGY